MSLVKKLLFFLALLIVFVMVALVLAAFNAQKIATALQPQIESLATSSLGTSVRLGELKLSVFPQIEIVAPEVHIGDAGEIKGLSLQEGSLTLDWFPLLYGKAVAQISLIKPRITVEKGKDGGISIPGLPLGKKQTPPASSGTEESNRQLPNSANTQKSFGALALDIRSIKVIDGTVNLIGLVPTVGNTPVEISDLEVQTTLKLDGQKALLNGISTKLSADKIGNFHLTGSNVEIDLASSTASWRDIWVEGPGIKIVTNGTASPTQYEIALDKSSFDLSKIAALSEVLTPLASAKDYRPTGDITLNVTAKGDLTQTSKLPLVNGHIDLQEISASLIDREVKNLNGSIIFDSTNTVQHVSSKKISLNFVDEAQLLKPLPVTVALENIEISQNLNIKIPTWRVETAGAVLNGNAVASLGQAEKKSAEISIDDESNIDLKLLKENVKALSVFDVNGQIVPAIKTLIDIKTGQVKGTGSIDLRSINYLQAPHSVSDITGNYDIEFDSRSGKARTNELKLKVNDVPLNIKTTVKAANNFTAFECDNLVISGLDGEITGNLLYSLPSSFTANIQSQTIGLPPLIKLARLNWLPESSGSLGPLNFGIKGQLGAKLMNSLSGKIALEARDTVFKGFNLAGTVLNKLNDIAIISGGLSKKAPEILGDYTSRKDTVVKDLKLIGIIQNGILDLEQLHLVSDVFELDGSGNIELPTNKLDLVTTFAFNKDFTQRVGTKVKEIERISAADGRLAFPLKVSGVPPKLLVIPDLGELLKMGAKKALQDQAGKLLDKALGGGGKGSSGAGKEVLDKLLNW